MNYSLKLTGTILLIVLIVLSRLSAQKIHDALVAGTPDKVKTQPDADPVLLESKDHFGLLPPYSMIRRTVYNTIYNLNL